MHSGAAFNVHMFDYSGAYILAAATCGSSCDRHSSWLHPLQESPYCTGTHTRGPGRAAAGVAEIRAGAKPRGRNESELVARLRAQELRAAVH